MDTRSSYERRYREVRATSRYRDEAAQRERRERAPWPAMKFSDVEPSDPLDDAPWRRLPEPPGPAAATMDQYSGMIDP